MRIGIDCRMWHETGIGRYVRNIIHELSHLDTKNTYVLFLLEKDIDSVEVPSNFQKVVANIRWHTFAEQLVLPLIFLRQNLDLLHVPHFNVPILYPKKFVATIHDLTILRVRTGRATTLPYPIYFIKHLAFKLNLFMTIKRARLIYTVSNFVKDDLIDTFGVVGDKIVLTPNAVDSHFKLSAAAITPVLQKYNITQPYLFYVGNAHPHKNLEILLDAFALVIKDFPDLSLVLGGKKRFFYERLESEWKDSSISERLKFIGFVDDADLPALYAGAAAFVNPSMYEGFGIQVLEAFACGTKVVCSNSTSLPEVGGEAAYYFDPSDAYDMASHIKTALKDVPESRIQEGFEQIKKFSWKKSAQKVLAGYETCAGF